MTIVSFWILARGLDDMKHRPFTAMARIYLQNRTRCHDRGT